MFGPFQDSSSLLIVHWSRIHVRASDKAVFFILFNVAEDINFLSLRSIHDFVPYPSDLRHIALIMHQFGLQIFLCREIVWPDSNLGNRAIRTRRRLLWFWESYQWNSSSPTTASNCSSKRRSVKHGVVAASASFWKHLNTAHSPYYYSKSSGTLSWRHVPLDSKWQRYWRFLFLCDLGGCQATGCGKRLGYFNLVFWCYSPPSFQHVAS